MSATTTAPGPDAPPPDAPPPGEPLPSLPVRIGQVFFAPAELFDRLKRKPAWAGALVTLIVINVVSVLLMPEDLLREMMMAGAPPDADPAALEDAARFGRIFSIVGAVIGPPLGGAVIAGAILVVYNVILGGEATFRQVFAATVHALFIATAGALLGLGLAVAKSDPQVSLSLHLLVPGLETDAYLYKFLRGLNVFSLWAAGVLGIAVSRLYRGRSAGSAAGLLVSLYVVLAALLALLPSPGAA